MDGNLDSRITFKNGKLNGSKKTYYSKDDIFYFDYRNNKLISHKIFDSAYHLKYQSPLNLKKNHQTKYHFVSGRDYYSKGKIDTITIDKDIPYMNEYVYFPGATVRSIGKYAWEISNWNQLPNSEYGKMIIDVSEYIVETPETVSKKSKKLRHKVILIPIK
jgi:antitoxin component YwqK of YwqJK toxin-antitoxin module